MFLVLTLVLLGAQADSSAKVPAQADEPTLADYRLTAPLFRQFVEASDLIAVVTRQDPRFTFAPLFTKEVTLSGDAPSMAAGLAARLDNDPALAAALRTAKLTAREYASFALALFAARLAHGFIASGVLRRVPPGPPADNVDFVGTHQAEITAVLATIGVRD